jgi:hypothetical protein
MPKYMMDVDIEIFSLNRHQTHFGNSSQQQNVAEMLRVPSGGLLSPIASRANASPQDIINRNTLLSTTSSDITQSTPFELPEFATIEDSEWSIINTNIKIETLVPNVRGTVYYKVKSGIPVPPGVYYIPIFYYRHGLADVTGAKP